MRRICIFAFLIFAATLFACRSKMKEQETVVSLEELKSYSARGDSIVKMTFDTLRSALAKSIGVRGVAGTIEYCNINAAQITATYAGRGITIRRTAGKFRNPDNAPDSLEKIILDMYAAAIGNERPLQNEVLKSGENVHFFKPILLLALCRNCHGNPGTDIPPDALAEIQKRYPGDMATGFRENDFRGMWHVTFSVKK